MDQHLFHIAPRMEQLVIDHPWRQVRESTAQHAGETEILHERWPLGQGCAPGVPSFPWQHSQPPPGGRRSPRAGGRSSGLWARMRAGLRGVRSRVRRLVA